MADFKPRFTRPEAGNKYYITKDCGGYSRAIKGKPTDKDCNVLSNCVGFAYGRFHEICERTQMDLFDPVNAENIYENAQQHGLKVGKEPKVGAAIVWEGIGSAAGHIEIVERVISPEKILCSSSGWNCKNPFWTQTRYKGTGNWGQESSYRFKGFIYQPQTETEWRVLKKGHYGDDVKKLQEALISKGYLRKGENDGDFGVITLGAVLAFQFENDLEVDGAVGRETQKALGLPVL